MKLLEILNMKGKRILTSKIHHDAVEEEEVRQPCDDNEHTTDDDDSSNSDFSSRSRSRSAMNVNLKANAIGNANGDTVVSQMAGDNGPIHTNGPNKDASGDGDGDGDTCAADQRSSPSKKMKTSPKSKPPNNARATQVIRPPDFFLPPYLRRYVHHSQGDFFVSSSFDPRLIAELMYEGFLPIASPRYLVPKLHKHRCVIYPIRTQTKNTEKENASTSNSTISAIHISKNVKKRAKKYTFTINRAFNRVVEGCHNQHGIGWLYDPIVRAFQDIHNRSGSAPRSNNKSQTQTYAFPVNLYSIEVWNAQTGELAAGELGYAAGTIYTSLTGFSIENSAGSVQLAALGQLLYKEGFEMWDLGMKLDYKIDLGSRDMERTEFVEKVRELRGKSRRIGSDGRSDGPLDLIACDEEKNCKSIITGE